CPEDREVRIQFEGTMQPAARGRPVAEAALDHPAVEVLERIARPEPEGALREAQRLSAAAVPRERPSQDVVAVDRRPVGASGSGEGERMSRPDAVIDVEEGRLEVR